MKNYNKAAFVFLTCDCENAVPA